MIGLGRFPRRTLRADHVLYRIHRAGKGAWWFSADGSGRFDPMGEPGVGCCYLAEAPLGAWVEVFRRQMLVDEADVRARRLLAVALGRELRLANLTSARALEHGVTATLGASEDYDESQAFAAAALRGGFEGIRYLVRHDPRQRLYGVALFGPSGAPDPTDPRWPGEPDEEIPGELTAEAYRRFRYRVVPRP